MTTASSLLLILSILSGFLAIHTFTTYPLSLALIKKWRKPASKPNGDFSGDSNATNKSEYQPSFGICVSAYNEEQSIGPKIQNLIDLASNYPGEVNIYVYDDCSSDSTPEIITGFSNEATIICGTQRGGKSSGMNTLLTHCHEDLIVFSDANVRIDLDALNVFRSYFEAPNVGCVCGTLEYFDDEAEVAAQTSSLYWRWEETIKQLESDTGSVIGADGSLFAIRRKLFQQVPCDIMDDFYTSLSVLCAGYEVKRAGEARAFERAAQNSAEEYRRKTRIACRAFNCYRELRAKLKRLSMLNRYKFLSHKILRWTGAGWIALCLSLFSGFLMLQLGAIVAIAIIASGIALMVVGHSLRLPIIHNISEMLLSFVGAGVGVTHSLRGQRFQTWEPAASAHKFQESPNTQDSAPSETAPTNMSPVADR